jgi:hypothetical protein
MRLRPAIQRDIKGDATASAASLHRRESDHGSSHRIGHNTRLRITEVGRVEPADLELDHDVAWAIEAEEQQVDGERVAVDVEAHLPAELAHGVAEPVDQIVLEFAFADVPVERPRKSKTYGSLTISRARSASAGSSCAGKLFCAIPSRWRRSVAAWCSSSRLDQPPATACAAYQSRSATSSTGSSALM